MIRLAVLASGRGSNLQAVLDAIDAGALDARVAGVFSDRPEAQALQRARDAGIRAVGLRPRDFATRLDYDAALFDAVDAATPDLIVCAGYMRLIGEPALAARAGRLVNIHPSLLPAFKGLHTHRQALAAGAPVHGASVHFVTPELDGGPVIAQARVPVLAGDDERTLAARVLAREHPLLLATLREFAAGRIAFNVGRVYRDAVPLARPLQMDDHGRLAPDASDP
ncbi:phosphoribosylglycinamide formyltransferase [Tolypothrix campylonemoides VB511288]|nr:phosphoribosylglycinamide formyltransferase [Tolypothrix campylonemoides VB511288]